MESQKKYGIDAHISSSTILYYVIFIFVGSFNLMACFFFPAAEVVKQEESFKPRRDLLEPAVDSNNSSIAQSTKLPSPLLSPSFSSDEDSVYSPSTIVNQDFQLDDLFDWDGQQLTVI
jgi:hypothetical protein